MPGVMVLAARMTTPIHKSAMSPPGLFFPMAPLKKPPLTRRAASANPIRTAHPRTLGSWVGRPKLRALEFGELRVLAGEKAEEKRAAEFDSRNSDQYNA
jgi:hypothetical protein